AVQGDREAVAVLDQGEELALFAGGRARGVVRAGNTKTKGSRNERRTIALLESAGYCCIKAGLISLGGLTKRRPTRKLMPQWLATSSFPLPNCRTSFLCTLRLYWRLNGCLIPASTATQPARKSRSITFSTALPGLIQQSRTTFSNSPRNALAAGMMFWRKR